MVDVLKARYEKDPAIVYRKIAGEAILVPIRRNVADLDSIYTLDEVGALIWELIDGQRTIGEIQAVVVDEYDASPHVVQADVVDFVRELEQIGVIKVA